MRFAKKHLSEEELVNLADGLLNDVERKAADEHLADCTRCTDEAAAAASLLLAMKSDDSRDAPAEAIRWSKNLFRARFAGKPRTLVSRIFALLDVDLSQSQPVFGERSGGAPTRQLLYKTNDIGVSIRVSNDDGEVSLFGQILGADFSDSRVELSGSALSQETLLNELSEFRFTKLPVGEYQMVIRRPDSEIVIEQLNLA